MNLASVITASIFLLFSVCALILLFVVKTPFSTGNYKNFYRACCGVYISGSLLVFIFTLIMKGLPVAFVIISNVTILFVFIFTVGLIYFMTRSIVEAARKAEAKHEEQNRKEN